MTLYIGPKALWQGNSVVGKITGSVIVIRERGTCS
jgi:hypothetical protein